MKTTQRDELALIFGADIAAKARDMVAQGKRLNLKSDSALKLFFCNGTPEADACLRSFLSAAIGRTVTEATVTNAELLPEYFGAKRPRLDINCRLNDGHRADIELQLTSAADNQLLRSVYYACKLYAGALSEGGLYRDIHNVYQIFLLDFALFPDRNFQHRGMFRQDDGTLLTDTLQILYFEMPKRAEGGNLNKMQNWCKFIGGCNERNIISELSADEAWKEDLDMALANYRNVSAEERSWAYHLSLDRAEADYRNGFRLAEEMGAQQANVATAQKLKQLGVSADIISQATGLSQQDIMSLQ